MYKNVNEAVKNPTILATIAGVCTPAMILPVAVIGIFGFALYKAFGFKKENQRLATANKVLKTEVERLEYDNYEEDEPLDNGTITVEPTVEDTVPEPLSSTVEDDEAFKKEMIRRTMSELGKRSAAARARKKVKD